MRKFPLILICLLLFQSVYINSEYLNCRINSHCNAEPFSDFLEQFISAFNDKNSAEINKCIYPGFGLFVLDNPGAFVIAEHFESFDDIMKLEGEYNIGFLKVCKVSCRFTKGKIPVYDCGNEESEGWNKTGCYYDDKQTLSVSEVYQKMLEFNLGDAVVIGKDMELAQKTEKYATHLAYSTDGAVGFYFGLVDGDWRLICIDKITPCDA